jgi:hypothetical protein
MTTLLKYIAAVLFFALAAMLIGYSASRGLDFIQSTLPESQRATGYLGLAGTEAGFIVWMLVFMFAAKSIGQYVTAGIMTLIDLAGAIALFTFDALLRSGESGMIAALTPEEIKTVILALNGLIGANIIATVAYHLADGETQKRISEAVMIGLLELKVMASIEKQGQAIVDAKAPELAAQYLGEFKGRFANAGALGLSVRDKEEDESPAWLDWQAWLDGWKAARQNGKTETITYNSDTTMPPFASAGPDAQPAPRQEREPTYHEPMTR